MGRRHIACSNRAYHMPLETISSYCKSNRGPSCASNKVSWQSGYCEVLLILFSEVQFLLIPSSAYVAAAYRCRAEAAMWAKVLHLPKRVLGRVWFMALVLKTSTSKKSREFKSHSARANSSKCNAATSSAAAPKGCTLIWSYSMADASMPYVQTNAYLKP